MKFNYCKLGHFIEEVSFKNLDGRVSKLMGLSVAKRFCKAKVNIEITNLESYKIVEPNQFAWRAIDVGRDGISIALSFFEEKILVSPAYIVFKVKDIQKIDPYYLFLFLKKKEFERYAKYHAWGSIRENFKWESLCDFQIPIISIEEQRKFIKEFSPLDEQIEKRIWLSEKIRDLIVLYKRFFHDSKKEKALGKNVKLVRRKNTNNEVKKLVGVSGTKKIVDYCSTIKGEDFSQFKVIEKNEFVWSPDILKLCALSCWTENEPILVSSAYQIFKIVNEEVLSLGYLMSCFFDPQFDRYATYHAWGSNRDKFKYPHLFNFKVSLIDSEIQTLFSYLYEWFLINEKIISLCEKRCQIVIESFEFLFEG